MDLYNKCLKFSENPKSGNQVYQGLATPPAIALARPGSYSPSTERGLNTTLIVKSLLVGGGSFRQPNPLTALSCGAEGTRDRAGSLSATPVLLPQVRVRPMVDW